MEEQTYAILTIFGMALFFYSFYIKEQNERIILSIASFVVSIVSAVSSFNIVKYDTLGGEVVYYSVEIALVMVLVMIIQLIRLFALPYDDASRMVENGR